MNGSILRRHARRVLLAVVAGGVLTLLVADRAQAAAEWEWTRGQGWSEGAGAPQPTAELQLKRAMEFERRGEYHEAAKQYFLTLRVYPDTDEAGVALQRLARCLFEMENFYQAFKAIEQVIVSYPRSGRMMDLLEIEKKIGELLLRGAPVTLLETNPDLSRRRSREAAAEVFNAMLLHDPYGSLADDALVGLGDANVLLQNAEKAREAYERLLREFPNSELADRARLGLARADVMEGKANPTTVQNVLEQVRQKTPDGQGDPMLQESINELEEIEAQKMLDAADFYERRGTAKSRGAALFTYQEISRRYPRTQAAAVARSRIGSAEPIPTEEKSRFLPDLSKVNLVPSFLRGDEDKPGFVTPQRNGEEVPGDVVVMPVPGVHDAAQGASAASVTPAAPGTPAIPPAPGAAVTKTPPDGALRADEISPDTAFRALENDSGAGAFPAPIAPRDSGSDGMGRAASLAEPAEDVLQRPAPVRPAAPAVGAAREPVLTTEEPAFAPSEPAAVPTASADRNAGAGAFPAGMQEALEVPARARAATVAGSTDAAPAPAAGAFPAAMRQEDERQPLRPRAVARPVAPAGSVTAFPAAGSPQTGSTAGTAPAALERSQWQNAAPAPASAAAAMPAASAQPTTPARPAATARPQPAGGGTTPAGQGWQFSEDFQ